MPILAVIGQYDFVVPPSMWECGLTRPRNFTLRYFTESGHTPQLKVPETFPNVLRDWMKPNVIL